MAATLEERVTALERGRRRWRIVAVVALVVALASVGMLLSGRPAYRRIRVHELAVVTPSGEPVATLAGEEAVGPVLRIRAGGSGGGMLLGSIGGGNVGLAIYEGGRPRVLLGLGKKGDFPALSMSDRSGRTRLLAGLDANESESPFLQMRDERDRVRIFVEVGEEPRFLMSDRAGGPLLSIPGKSSDKERRQRSPRR